MKLALVTGASRGIGKAIAAQLAKEGYSLFITSASSGEDLEQVAGLLQESCGITCIPVVADMGDYKQVEQLFDQIRAVGTLDVLINNAGISYVGLLQDMSVENWHRVMQVNLDSMFYTCRLALPGMISKGKGKIINISSVWGNAGASCEVAYSASKGGVNSFTKALAKEVAPSGIQVNAIACGMIDTKMNACFTPEDIAEITAEIPADRMGTPEEVASLVSHLLQGPDYLTGQIVTMDGGWIG